MRTVEYRDARLPCIVSPHTVSTQSGGAHEESPPQLGIAALSRRSSWIRSVGCMPPGQYCCEASPDRPLPVLVLVAQRLPDC